MSARSVGSVGVTSVVTGGLAYVTLVVFARIAGEAAFVAFAVLWAAYYGVAAGFAGLQQDVTRVALERRADGTRLWGPAAALVAATGVATAATAPWWGRGIDVDVPTAGLVLLALCSLGGLVVVLGVLAAEGDWWTWSLLLLLDAALRLVAVTLVAALDGGLAWQAAAIGSGSLVWLPLAGRSSLGPRAGAWSGAVRSALAAMSATGFAALVVAGLPLLAAATSADDLEPSLAGLLAALVLLRSPVLLVVNAYRPMLVVRVVEGGGDAWSPVWGLWRLVVLGGVLATTAGYVVGPWVLRVTFGADYTVVRTTAALLVLSAVTLTLLTLSSTALIATGRAAAASRAWALTVVTTVALLLAVDGDAHRIVAAAVLGPLPAVLWHAVLLHVGPRKGEQL